MPIQGNTVLAGLKKEFSAIANLKLADDAAQPQNAQFLDALMQMIQGFVTKAQVASLGPPQMPPGGAPPAPGAQPGSPPGAGGAGLGVGPPGSAPPAVSNNPNAMDEIRRMMSATANP